MGLFEGLEVQSQQGAERLLGEGVRLLPTTLDSLGERREVWVMLGVEAWLLDELPQALNEVTIRGAGRPKQELDVELGGVRWHEGATAGSGRYPRPR